MALGERSGDDVFGRQVRPDRFVLGGGIGRRPPRPDRRSLYGSLAVHGGLIAIVVVSALVGARDIPEFETFAVRIYSPPPQVEGPPAPAPVVEQTIVSQPTPAPPKPQPKPKPPPPKPVEQTPVEVPVEQPKPKEPEKVAGQAPDPASTGGENLDVNIQGQEFPYPEYLQNIIRQINRYFRWSGDGTPSAVVMFYINRDGTVGGLNVLEKSADFRFNLETMSSVELAGRANAFGELPEGWVQDRLWVKFRFLPPGR